MRRTDQLFRRNFVVAVVMHGVFIAGVVLFEGWSVRKSEQADVVPVFYLPENKGDMPKGAGTGRGIYTPAPPAGGREGGPAEAVLPSHTEMGADETPAPPAPAAPVKSEPGDYNVAKKGKDAAKPKKAPPAADTAKTPSASAKAAAPAAKPAIAPKTVSATAKTSGTGGSGTGSGTGKGSGPSAKDIRNLFASALTAGKGGTPYGDNRAPGGGNGSSSVIGSPNGTDDGVVGGHGAGTPFAWYYQHVHDRMYEAWQEPGRAVNYDKRLVSTVRLRIARDGTILEAKLSGGSGNELMDDSAVRAARSVPKLDPLPDGLGTMTAEIFVDFRLKG